MAIEQVNISTDLVSNFVTKYNNTTDEIYTGATSNGLTLTLNKQGGTSTSVTLNVVKEKGETGTFGTATTVSSSLVSINSIIVATWKNVTGVPGILWVDNIDPGVSFDICTTVEPTSGNICWALLS